MDSFLLKSTYKNVPELCVYFHVASLEKERLNPLHLCLIAVNFEHRIVRQNAVHLGVEILHFNAINAAWLATLLVSFYPPCKLIKMSNVSLLQYCQ